jgi:hypothetical protein
MWATYEDAVGFIAVNDKPLEKRPEYIADQDMVVMAASLFHRTPEEVAQDIIIARAQEPDSSDQSQLAMFSSLPEPEPDTPKGERSLRLEK